MLRKLLWWLSERYWGFRFRLNRNQLDRLRERGMRVGRGVVIMPEVVFDTSYPWLVEIEDGCRISSEVRILAHDATPFKDLGVTRLGRVRILHDTFIAERAIILPGVTIGPRAMVAAGSVVNRDVGEGAIVAGNPARVLGRFDEYLERARDAAGSARIVALDELISGRVRSEDVLAAMDRGEAVYVRGATAGSPFYVNTSDAEVQALAQEAYERNLGSKPV